MMGVIHSQPILPHILGNPESSISPEHFLTGGTMNMTLILRYTILTVSAAAVVLGLLVIAGLLKPRYFPDDNIRVILGAVILLYGLYRFVNAYIQKPGRRTDERL